MATPRDVIGNYYTNINTLIYSNSTFYLPVDWETLNESYLFNATCGIVTSNSAFNDACVEIMTTQQDNPKFVYQRLIQTQYALNSMKTLIQISNEITPPIQQTLTQTVANRSFCWLVSNPQHGSAMSYPYGSTQHPVQYTLDHGNTWQDLPNSPVATYPKICRVANDLMNNRFIIYNRTTAEAYLVTFAGGTVTITLQTQRNPSATIAIAAFMSNSQLVTVHALNVPVGGVYTEVWTGVVNGTATITNTFTDNRIKSPDSGSTPSVPPIYANDNIGNVAYVYSDIRIVSNSGNESFDIINNTGETLNNCFLSGDGNLMLIIGTNNSFTIRRGEDSLFPSEIIADNAIQATSFGKGDIATISEDGRVIFYTRGNNILVSFSSGDFFLDYGGLNTVTQPQFGFTSYNQVAGSQLADYYTWLIPAADQGLLDNPGNTTLLTNNGEIVVLDPSSTPLNPVFLWRSQTSDQSEPTENLVTNFLSGFTNSCTLLQDEFESQTSPNAKYFVTTHQYAPGRILFQNPVMQTEFVKWTELDEQRRNSAISHIVRGMYCGSSITDNQCRCMNNVDLLKSIINNDMLITQPQLFASLLPIATCVDAYCANLRSNHLTADNIIESYLKGIQCPTEIVICSTVLNTDNSNISGGVQISQECGSDIGVDNCDLCPVGTTCVDNICRPACVTSSTCDSGNECINNVCIGDGGGGDGGDGGDEGLPVWAIAVIVVGIAIVIVTIAVVTWWYTKGRYRNKSPNQPFAKTLPTQPFIKPK